ncbi:OX-2 membrane glycoprotein-like isoform X2 [Channa argus]|uniref:OX-2 membrane glycoprotein-like isoform X2 n=1 Tax=Channa argus TaxID=215402 RepID=UPI003521F117
MCGSALPLSLLLWTAISTTEGKVTALASVTAEAGRPFILGCNITTVAGDTIRQVRWTNNLNKLILAYEQSVPVRISHQQANIQLTRHHNDASYITIKNVQPQDEGCYTCYFDVFPSGSQEAKTCIKVSACPDWGHRRFIFPREIPEVLETKGRVHLHGNKTAISGKPATLSCWYSISKQVVQVLWKKTAEQGDTTRVVSYAMNGHYNLEKQFVDRVNLSRTLDNSELTIQSVKTEDEACYTCEFHTYPDGSKSGTACLSVYVLPNPEVTHVTMSTGITEANCTAQSRPAAEITWNVDGDNRTSGPPIVSEYDQGDGTTIVTSTLSFQTVLLNQVKCIVNHSGLEKPLSVSVNPNMAPAMVILLSVCGVAAVLLLCLCVCLCKCFVCIED